MKKRFLEVDNICLPVGGSEWIIFLCLHMQILLYIFALPLSQPVSFLAFFLFILSFIQLVSKKLCDVWLFTGVKPQATSTSNSKQAW